MLAPSNRSFVPVLFASLTACSGGNFDLAPADSGTTPEDVQPPPSETGSDVGSDAIDSEPEPTAPDLVKTKSGPVNGTVRLRSREFLGIPYAAPPKGALRWKPPEPVAPWTEARDATKFGNYCPQPKSVFAPPTGVPDEDCLLLNVWTPLPVPTKAPVMVFIHGGSAVYGSGADPTYVGRNIAEKSGAIVVTINYRLGPLGFLAHSKLGANGNQGLLDQQAALRWIHDSIGSFGGDAGNVTLFGESAGSVSVCAQIAMTGSAGLFHRAIMESGGCSETLPSLASAEIQTEALAKNLGCDPASDFDVCMRTSPAEGVIKAMPPSDGSLIGSGWGPVLDGKVFAKPPYRSIQAGTFNKVPVLLGSNHDEGTMFVLDRLLMGEWEYTKTITSVFGADASAVLARYPAKSYSSPAMALARVAADFAFICPARRDARAFRAASVPTFLYHFTHKPSFNPFAFMGAYHGAELPFVFHNPPASTPVLPADEDSLSWSMLGYWSRFAAKGDPNDSASVSWPKFDVSEQHLSLDSTIESGSGLFRDACDFADSITP